MTGSALRGKADELRRQFAALQQLSREDLERAEGLRPTILVELQRSMDELQDLVAAPSGVEGTGSTLAAWSDGERLDRDHLRSLMADLLLAEERERRRLAIDLHDGLSQTIALARIKLSALRTSLDASLGASLHEIEELIKETDRTARSVGFELSPPVLHDLGLEPAVQWLVENIKNRYGIEIVLEDDRQLKPADETTRVILFRSIRELLINAAKHAEARRVHVRLRREANRLSVTVEDDGVGMNLEAESAKGFGLFSIHERLNHVGGSMTIESAPGSGTRIRLCVPIANERALTTVEA